MKTLFGLLLLLSSFLVMEAKLGESHVKKQVDADQRALMTLQYYGGTPAMKLGRCEGDCDSDNDCASSDLTCFQRSSGNTPVPGCSGGNTDSSSADYCILKADLNRGGSAVAQFATKQIEWSTNFPLAVCQGDCDSDFDCQGGLVCFQKNEKQAVPGCIGGEHDWSKTDYCVSQATKDTQPRNRADPPGVKLPVEWSSNFPLGRCQGDCDSDNDCQGNLKCYQRNGGKSVPSCLNGGSDWSNVDYCYDPDFKLAGRVPATNFGNGRTAQYLGGGDFSANPLGVCQGDCDNDNDCSPGLFCWQRNAGESLPYCTGAAGSVDYCVPKSEAPGTKLRLYWDNYYWQDTNEEAFWCMECAKCDRPPFETADGYEGNCRRRDRCEEGDLIWIEWCRDVRHRFEIIKNNGSGDQIRAYGTNLCFQHREDRGQFMELRPCDRNRGAQLWTPITNRGKFGIRPYYQRNRSSRNAKCVSQLHHPKAEEVLSLRQCWLNQHYETNNWEVWY